jgi:hypothetical protein
MEKKHLCDTRSLSGADAGTSSACGAVGPSVLVLSQQL